MIVKMRTYQFKVRRWAKLRGIILGCVRLMASVKDIRAIRLSFKNEISTILSK